MSSQNKYNPSQPKELGRFLKKVREEQGHTVRDVCDSTRLSRRIVLSIEEGDFSNLPGGMFNRSFVQIYANWLGIDKSKLNPFYIELSQDTEIAEIVVVQTIDHSISTGNPHIKPPKLAEYLLYLFLSRRERINLLGDLEEEYRDVAIKFGKRHAKLFYYKQVFTSLAPLIGRSIQKLRYIAWLLELWRRIYF